MISSQWASSQASQVAGRRRQRVHSIKQSVTVCIIAEVKCCFEHIPHKLHNPREHVRGMVPCTHGLSQSSVASVPRLLLLCAVLACAPFRRLECPTPCRRRRCFGCSRRQARCSRSSAVARWPRSPTVPAALLHFQLSS